MFGLDMCIKVYAVNVVYFYVIQFSTKFDYKLSLKHQYFFANNLSTFTFFFTYNKYIENLISDGVSDALSDIDPMLYPIELNYSMGAG